MAIDVNEEMTIRAIIIPGAPSGRRMIEVFPFLVANVNLRNVATTPISRAGEQVREGPLVTGWRLEKGDIACAQSS